MEFLLDFYYFLVILGPCFQHIFQCRCRTEILGLDCSSTDLIDAVNGNEIKSLLRLILEAE